MKINIKTIFASAFLASSFLAISIASAAEPCKAYVKMDLGYAKTFNTRITAIGLVPDGTSGKVKSQAIYNQPLYKDPNGLVILAGAGYAFNDAMRAEILLDFKPKMKSYDHGIEIDTREIGGNARVLYDFNNNTPVTPFIFGSLGATSVKPKNKPDVKSLPLTDVTAVGRVVATVSTDGTTVTAAPNLKSISQKSKTVMTYGVGGGLSFKTSDVMHIDFTYGVAKKGNVVTITNFGIADIDSKGATINAAGVQTAKFKKQLDQSLTIGLRFTM